MKKNLMKKVFAVTLSVAMACSIIPATNPVTASAAASVKLKTARKTLQVGQKYKLTLKNNTQKWKVVKATSKAPKIAKVYKTTSKAVKVKGKSEGKAVVKVRIKTAQTKSNNVKNLKCTFTVVDNSTPTPTPEPTPDPTPVQTDATVKTQEELDAALANSNITKITIDTEEEIKFVIKDGTYSTVDLIVNAPKADIENSATFRNITIQAIKGETWTEKGKGNVFKLLAKIVSFIIDKDATVNGVEVATADADVKLTVNGKLAKATVSAKAKIAISGESKEPVDVEVTSNAKDTEMNSSVPVKVEASADMKVNLTEGAEKSTIKFAVADLNIELDNKTKEPVEITKHDNTKTTVAAGRKQTVTSPAQNTPVTPGVSQGTTTPINKVDPNGTLDLTGVIINTGASIYVTTGSATVISGGTFTFTVSGAKEVSGSAIECSARVKSGQVNRFLTWQDCTAGTTFTVSPIFGCSTEFDIELSFRIKETNVTKVGPVDTLDKHLKITFTARSLDNEKDKNGYTLRTKAQCSDSVEAEYVDPDAK